MPSVSNARPNVEADVEQAVTGGSGGDLAVSFRDVDKIFRGPEGEVAAVKGLNFEVRRGELVALVGQTGCGKSTAFNLLLGLFPPTSGEVRLDGFDPHGDFDDLKGRVAVVFQDDRLLPWRTAQDNVALGLQYAGRSKSERREIAARWLARLGLEGREDAYPHQLSGGMRQRVGIARCFALDPDTILCDESFSALDELTADQLRDEFVKLVRDEGKTGVFITHSIEEALTMGERVLVFRAPGHVSAEIRVPEQLEGEELGRYRALVRRAMAGEVTGRLELDD
jgi:NitT/TauT family transport system ATP-binding protein